MWRWNGVNIVYYLSGLHTIPTDHYEAAQIDGANAWQQFIHVTLPGIRPVLIYLITITVLGGFSMFTESVALWQQNNAGGVGRTIVGCMYMVGFKKNNIGLASAVGLVLFVHILAAEGGMDEDVIKSLTGKEKAQEALLTALKAKWQKAKGA